MKPVYIQHTRQDLLGLNPKLREYLNLHAGFFYPRVDGQYDRSKVNVDVFRERYLNRGYVVRKDRNHPEKQQLQTIDIESYDLHDISKPAIWRQWIREVRQILHAMKSTGREVMAYGLDGDKTFANYWELYRRQFVLRRPDLTAKKMAKVNEKNRAIRKVNRALRDLIDVNSVRGYTDYKIPSADSWECDAFIYQLERRCEYRKHIDPKKPLAVWLQPNDTDDFEPLPLGVWQRIYGWAQMNPHVDRIMIFTLNAVNGQPVHQSDSWHRVFTESVE